MRVTTAEFLKEYGPLSDKALDEPLTITENGRDRLVVLSVKEYQRLRSRDRRAFRTRELSSETLALIAATEMAPEHSHLDKELDDWQP